MIRTISSTRSALPSTSRRHVGTVTLLPFTSKPSLSRISRWRCFGDFDAPKRPRALEIEVDRPLFQWRFADADHCGRPASADVEDQAAQDREPLVQKGRVDPALEPASGIACEAECLAGPRDVLGCEVGDLQHDVARSPR